MSEYFEQMQEILANREHSFVVNHPREICLYVFQLALKDEHAAELLYATSNRFNQHIRYYVSPEEMVAFAKCYPHLRERLINEAQIDGELLVQIRGLSSIPEKVPTNMLRPCFYVHRDDGRTKLAAKNNRHVEVAEGMHYVRFGGARYPLVTRDTRNFNVRLSSAGSGTREIIRLEPSSLVLNLMYQKLKKDIFADSLVENILTAVSLATQNAFKRTDVDALIQNKLNMGENFLLLDEFILAGKGICRHHALLNAYLLTRLIEDRILSGDVILHRQEIGTSAHAWNLFRDQVSGKLYSLDSLWKNLTSLADRPGQLNRLYGCEVEAILIQRFGSAERHGARVCINSDDAETPVLRRLLESTTRIESAENIKQFIEVTAFRVGRYRFFQGGVNVTLSNGETKRMPHRVAKIYKEITTHERVLSEQLQIIKQIARTALDHPRKDQDGLTRVFYENVISGTISP